MADKDLLNVSYKTIFFPDFLYVIILLFTMYKTLIYKKEKSLKMVYFLFEYYFKVFKNCINKKDILLEC